MLWNSKSNEYVGTLPDGTEIHVDADVYAEAEQAARKDGSNEDLSSPLVWENNADGESVRIVKK